MNCKMASRNVCIHRRVHSKCKVYYIVILFKHRRNFKVWFLKARPCCDVRTWRANVVWQKNGTCGKHIFLQPVSKTCSPNHKKKTRRFRALNPVQTLSVRFVFVFFFFLLIKNPIQSRFKSAVSAFFFGVHISC